LIQISDDLEDLEPVLKKEGKQTVIGSGKCSALVKPTEGNKELFVSQDTWSSYGTMLRVQKKYSFGYHLVRGSTVLNVELNFICVIRTLFLSFCQFIL